MEEIKSIIIIEMMGRPPEHLRQVMKDFLKKLGSEKGVKVTNKKTHKPKLFEQKDKEGKIIEMPKGQELYSVFSEIDLETKELFDLLRIVFLYMPSHIEIISPLDLKMPNDELGGMLTEITKKLHQYDAIAKNAIMQNKILVTRLQEQGVDVQEGFGQKQEEKPKSKKK